MSRSFARALGRLVKSRALPLAAALVVAGLQSSAALATNPLIMDQFTADPTARVFDG